jgi:hypothetical protein
MMFTQLNPETIFLVCGKLAEVAKTDPTKVREVVRRWKECGEGELGSVVEELADVTVLAGLGEVDPCGHIAEHQVASIVQRFVEITDQGLRIKFDIVIPLQVGG